MIHKRVKWGKHMCLCMSMCIVYACREKVRERDIGPAQMIITDR